MTSSPQDYLGAQKTTWCKGCSFHGILSAITETFAGLKLDPAKVSVITGIGCSSRLAFFLNTPSMHTLHGRAIPVAVGARLARPDIPVIVAGGDGDLFSIGIGHFVHAARKNFNMTVICMDNGMYAMTKNQVSPTSPQGHSGSLTPYGKLCLPLNVLEFAIACETTFVSRTFAGSPEHMKEIFTSAIKHNGFSFVEVIAPCITFDHNARFSSLKGRLIDINKELAHDPGGDKRSASALASAAPDNDSHEGVKIPIGIFRRVEAPTFEKRVSEIKR